MKKKHIDGLTLIFLIRFKKSSRVLYISIKRQGPLVHFSLFAASNQDLERIISYSNL